MNGSDIVNAEKALAAARKALRRNEDFVVESKPHHGGVVVTISVVSHSAQYGRVQKSGTPPTMSRRLGRPRVLRAVRAISVRTSETVDLVRPLGDAECNQGIALGGEV